MHTHVHTRMYTHTHTQSIVLWQLKWLCEWRNKIDGWSDGGVGCFDWSSAKVWSQISARVSPEQSIFAAALMFYYYYYLGLSKVAKRPTRVTALGSID